MHDFVRSGGIRLGMPFGSIVLAVAIVALLAIVVLGLREQRFVGDARRRWVLHALRIASALLALLFFIQPEWTQQRVRESEGRVAIVVDASRSMSVRQGEKSRIEQAKEIALRYVAEAKQKPSLFFFGDELTAATTEMLRAPDLALRDDTRIVAALRELNAQDPDLGAIVLLSDGAERGARAQARTPEEIAPSLGELGVRVHTVTIGEEKLGADTAIESVHADAVAFLRQAAEVQVKVRAPAGHAAPLPVTLRRDGEVVHETDAQLDADGTATVTLPFVPTRVGRAVYTLSVPLADDDSVPENNERAFMVRVVRERLRVLLVCGHPSWDARFLRAFLKNNPSIDLITFFILRTATDNSVAPPEELSLIPFPTEELFEEHIDSFDLVVFQDFDFGPYQMARYLPRIRQYVVAGGSFAMLGGDRSFGTGGYAGTPIADVLPVELAVGERTLDEHEFSPVVVESSTHHPIVELSPRALDNVAAWKALAPFSGTNLIAGVKADSQALLVHPTLTGASGEAMPVLSVGTAGKGRTLALTTDSSYRLGLSTAGRTGDASAYEHFWDRSLRWLARDPLLDPAQVSTDRESYGPGANMRVSVFLRDDHYRPLGPGLYRLSIRDARGAAVRELPVETDAQGQGLARLTAPVSLGGYSIEAHAEGSAEPLASESFVVEGGGEELADPRANPALLRAISKATGGDAHDGADQAPRYDSLSRTRTRVLGTSVIAPCRTPWFFALLVACFGLEWFLRRRFGLR